MITDDADLAVTRRQLAHAEAALESLRRDVKPKNERLYALMSESYIEMVQSLRSDIDVYLGITPVMTENTAPLTISLEGAHVGLGQTSAALVTRVIDSFRKGLQSLVEIVHGDRSLTGRRRERWIEELCDLPLVGVASGSLKIMLGEPLDNSLFSDSNRELLQYTIEVLFDGLEWAGNGDTAVDLPRAFEKLDVTIKQAILSVVAALLPPKTGPIETIGFSTTVSGKKERTRTASLGRRSRQRIHSAMMRLSAPNGAYREVVGIIRRVDLDNRTFVLRRRSDFLADKNFKDGPDLACEYDDFLADIVKAALDTAVWVTGFIEVSRKGRKETMQVEAIEILSGGNDEQVGEASDTSSNDQPQ